MIKTNAMGIVFGDGVFIWGIWNSLWEMRKKTWGIRGWLYRLKAVMKEDIRRIVKAWVNFQA